MHILAQVVAIFIICLYLMSIEAYLILAIVLILIGTLLYLSHPKLLVLIMICPILAFSSLKLYETYGEVDDHYLVAQKGFKRFKVAGEIKQYRVGDILSGDLEFDKINRNASGYLGKITVSSPKCKQDYFSKIRRIRDNLTQQVIREYGFDRGSLMASLVLGYTEDLNKEREGAMKTMGIMHILSISGFHFALLEVALKKMRFGPWRYPLLGAYAIFVNSISGYRTILTLLYKIIGKLMKKDGDLITGTFLALFIQGFISPYLIFHTGYLLTYLSTLGILLFNEKINRLLVSLPSFLKDSISLTLAALSLSFPVILTFSPEFSLGVFAGNMILVPLYVITTYLSFLGIMVMNIPLLKWILLPFIEVFFDLSYYMGSFLSHYAMKISLENMLNFYVPFLLLVILLYKKKQFKGLIVLILLIFLLEIPYGPALAIYNKYGTPYVRITQNFKNYDIMDYRVAEGDVISLRENQEILLDGHLISLKLGEKKRDIPIIYIDGQELNVERNVDYIRGLRQERKYFFINKKIMRIK